MSFNQRGAEIDTKESKFMGFINEKDTDIQSLMSINDSQDKLIVKKPRNDLYPKSRQGNT